MPLARPRDSALGSGAYSCGSSFPQGRPMRIWRGTGYLSLSGAQGRARLGPGVDTGGPVGPAAAAHGTGEPQVSAPERLTLRAGGPEALRRLAGSPGGGFKFRSHDVRLHRGDGSGLGPEPALLGRDSASSDETLLVRSLLYGPRLRLLVAELRRKLPQLDDEGLDVGVQALELVGDLRHRGFRRTTSNAASHAHENQGGGRL
jgi:hypothetical protein